MIHKQNGASYLDNLLKQISMSLKLFGYYICDILNCLQLCGKPNMLILSHTVAHVSYIIHSVSRVLYGILVISFQL